MAVIGTFTKKGDNYNGSIRTLAIQADVTIKAVAKTKDTSPSHKLYAGAAEVGAAWEKVSKEGVPYLSVSIDDPNLPSAIKANLTQIDGSKYDLIWSR